MAIIASKITGCALSPLASNYKQQRNLDDGLDAGDVDGAALEGRQEDKVVPLWRATGQMGSAALVVQPLVKAGCRTGRPVESRAGGQQQDCRAGGKQMIRKPADDLSGRSSRASADGQLMIWQVWLGIGGAANWESLG